MIYLDNAATSLARPPAVARAVADALETLGGAGRGAHGPAFAALRTADAARKAIAALAGAGGPLQVAFTSGATEALNLLIGSLIGPEDHVITSVLEHNSVLRPLYKSGCALDFIDCDDAGALDLDNLPNLLRPNTTALVCTCGSNLLGSITNTAELEDFCAQNGLILILDAAQTLGALPCPPPPEGGFVCFTGHKSLFGPQGTGGVIAGAGAPACLYKTGGTGGDSFAHHQPLSMPDMLEAGTPNAHGLAGLAAGAAFVLETGSDVIHQREMALTRRFLEGIAGIPGLTVYGEAPALPIVALNLAGMPSEEVSLALWEEAGVATRPGGHCAPLAHRRFGTEGTGMVRFSFGWYNTEAEADAAAEALASIARQGGG